LLQLHSSLHRPPSISLSLTLALQINKDSGASVDVGGGNAFGGGGEDEAVDDTAEVVNNVIDESIGFGYNEVPMGKKDFKQFLQGYVKKVWEMLKEDPKIEKEQVKEFKQAGGEMCNYLLKMTDEFSFYMSCSFNPDGCMVFGYYKEGSVTPTFMYIKAGLLEEKC